jgi:hypothetical protein
MKKEYARLLDRVIQTLCNGDQKARSAAIREVKQRLADINYDEVKNINDKYLAKVEKLIVKYIKETKLSASVDLEKIKASNLKSLYILWCALKAAYDENEKQGHNIAVSKIVEVDAVPSPFSAEVISNYNRTRKSIKEVIDLSSGRKDAAFDQMLSEMRDVLIDVGEIIFINDRVVHKLISELYDLNTEELGDTIGKYFKKLKTEYQTKVHLEYLAKYCNYFPSKSLGGMSPIEALYATRSKPN